MFEHLLIVLKCKYKKPKCVSELGDFTSMIYCCKIITIGKDKKKKKKKIRLYRKYHFERINTNASNRMRSIQPHA